MCSGWVLYGFCFVRLLIKLLAYKAFAKGRLFFFFFFACKDFLSSRSVPKKKDKRLPKKRLFYFSIRGSLALALFIYLFRKVKVR
jgi:hypothetical protein